MSFEIRVRKRLGERDIALDLEAEGGVTILFGPSGAGKTSVLNMVAGLLRPDTGTIRVGGATVFDAAAGIDVAVEQRRAGYVFQDARLFPHLSVQANLQYGAPKSPSPSGEGWGWGSADRNVRVTSPPPAPFPKGREAEIAFLDIAALLDRWPRSLSGGEVRRVAIGRALLSNPDFLLLDEPLSSLDAPRREEISRAIEHLRDVVQLPILMVTHDAAEAERLATRIVTMGR